MEKSLFEKLKSLGVQLGAKQLPTPQINSKIPIEEIISGREISTNLGSSFLVERNYPANHHQGSVELLPDFPYPTIALWAKAIPQPLEKLVFLDTETSGLAGGTGTFVFMIGLGYWRNNEFTVRQLFMREPSEELGLLASLDEILSEFDTLVTFNGKSFDVPLLNTRYIINKYHSSLRDKQHLDILMLARRVWRNRLSDRSLGSLETNILKFTRSEEEIPGWMVPDIYYDYLHTGDAQPLAGVFYHNEMDIVSLAAIFRHLALAIENPEKIPPSDRIDLIAVARLFEDLKATQKAYSIYEHGINSELPTDFTVQALERNAHIAKREGNLDLAVNLWMRAAELGGISACEELAKYFEHQSKDNLSAQKWVFKGLKFLEEETVANRNSKNSLVSSFNYRLVRLQRKLSRLNPTDP